MPAERMPLTDPPGGEPTDGETPEPELELLEGSQESIFNPGTNAAHFEELVELASAQFDPKKLYGLGTVIEPTTAIRMRHLRRVADIDESQAIDSMIAGFNKLTGKKKGQLRYEDIVPPHSVADTLTFRGDDERYLVVEAVTLGLLRSDSELDVHDRLGPVAVRNLHTMLVYAVDPESFTDSYNQLIKDSQ